MYVNDSFLKAGVMVGLLLYDILLQDTYFTYACAYTNGIVRVSQFFLKGGEFKISLYSSLESPSSGIQLISVDGGYFFWNATSDFGEAAAFVCESPQLDIGCYLEDLGADYNGTASRRSVT